ncbi:hypothetical protein IAI10_21405 [Clostridium sp. 19966]|uniref:hypothetical protein n=1 Tax=Clostridium sp. 19966 TaxID=2768166 RepID=UPI0028DE751A|nr:hypothetical protein [Clostridium sp. 19966]MDT8719213.1 hypothetical protein [Clostridium sp. 19966]
MLVLGVIVSLRISFTVKAENAVNKEVENGSFETGKLSGQLSKKQCFQSKIFQMQVLGGKKKLFQLMYTIPIIEIIRNIIAPDIFTLNRVVEMDMLENFFIYELTGNKLDIYFSSEYEEKLLSNEKINHLAWIITNPQIFKMFNSIGKNLWLLISCKVIPIE